MSRKAAADLKAGKGARLLELRPGEISQPIPGGDAYYILKLERICARTDAPPFEQVQSRFVDDLMRQGRLQRLNQLLDRLRREGHVKIFDSSGEEVNTSQE